MTTWEYKNELSNLLRSEFAFAEPSKLTSFEELICRMKENQKDMKKELQAERTETQSERDEWVHE